MSKTDTKLDLRAFATWLKQQRPPAATEQGLVPSSEERLAAVHVWEVVQEGLAEVGRMTFRPLKLAAADGQGDQMPLEFRTEQGLLEFMRVGTSDRWRVVFRAEPSLISALLGRRPKVLIGGEELLLSEIDDRGLARADVPDGLVPGDLLGFELR